MNMYVTYKYLFLRYMLYRPPSNVNYRIRYIINLNFSLEIKLWQIVDLHNSVFAIFIKIQPTLSYESKFIKPSKHITFKEQIYEKRIISKHFSTLYFRRFLTVVLWSSTIFVVRLCLALNVQSQNIHYYLLYSVVNHTSSSSYQPPHLSQLWC